jgi:hypothetical protein
MIPRRYWLADGSSSAYCSPECEALEVRVEALSRRFREPARPEAKREP